MYDGTLASSGCWQALITFQQMIILADAQGVVDITPQALSRRTTIPLDIILTGIEALEQPDPDSRSPKDDGRRIVRLSEHRKWGWQLVNYEHYRNLRNADDRRESKRQWDREHRGKKPDTSDADPTTSDSIRQEPSHPADAEASSSSEAKKKTRARRVPIPENFQVTDAMRRWADSETPTIDVAAATSQFVDHHRGKGNTFIEPELAWRTWMRNCVQYGKPLKPASQQRQREML